MRIRRILILVVAALVAAGAGYAVVIKLRSGQVVSAAPGGPYEVGRSERQWVDRTRTDEFAPTGGTPRMLSVWLWYPVAAGTAGPTAAYAPGAWKALHKFGIAETSFARIATGTISGAAAAPGRFPLVVFLPGLGFSAPQYAGIAASLAARGYVVAGVTPTYSANLTVLDGRAVTATAAGNPRDVDDSRAGQLVAVWSQDARFAAAETEAMLAGEVDARRVVYAGHSLGGAAAYEACRQDIACAGAADLDGTPYGPVVTAGLAKPVLLLSSEKGGAAGDASAHRLFAACTSLSLAYTITGAEHFDFTDYALYYLPAPLRAMLPLGSIDGGRAITIVDAYLGAFADRATRGAQWTAPTYPEARPADMLSG